MNSYFSNQGVGFIILDSKYYYFLHFSLHYFHLLLSSVCLCSNLHTATESTADGYDLHQSSKYISTLNTPQQSMYGMYVRDARHGKAAYIYT